MSQGDWKNHEKRREDALKSGYMAPSYALPRVQVSKGGSQGGSHYGVGQGGSAYGASQGGSVYGAGPLPGKGGLVNPGYQHDYPGASPRGGDYPDLGFEQPPGYTAGGYTPQQPYGGNYAYGGESVYGGQAPGGGGYANPPGNYPPPINYPQTAAFRNPSLPSHEIESVEEEFEFSKQPRKCRDIVFLAIFLAFLGLMVGIVVFAMVTGSYSRVGENSWNQCNVRGKLDARAMNFTNTRDAETIVVDYGEQLLVALEELWPNIVYMGLIGLGLSFVMTILLRFFAGPIIWFVVVLFVLLSIGLVVGGWVFYVVWGDGETWVLVLAIALTVIGLMSLLLMFFMRRKIDLVIRLFKEAGKAIHAVPLVLIQPLVTFFFQVLVTGVFIALVVLIETSRRLDNEVCVMPLFAQISRFINIAAFLWVTMFVFALQHTVVAGTIATYYFTRDKSRLGSPILVSIKIALRYHVGSLALGSFCIAVIQFFRWLFNMMARVSRSTNLWFISWIFWCAAWCFDNLLLFFNRNAYIQIAIRGKPFCTSAKRAFNVVMENALKVIAINSIGDFVLLLAKIVCLAISVAIGYFLFKGTMGSRDFRDVEWTVLFAGAVFTFIFIHSFISTYEMAIDTIFMCFCEDLAMNDGIHKPYFMSVRLMKLVKENQKRMQKHLEQQEKKEQKKKNKKK